MIVGDNFDADPPVERGWRVLTVGDFAAGFAKIV